MLITCILVWAVLGQVWLTRVARPGRNGYKDKLLFILAGPVMWLHIAAMVVVSLLPRGWVASQGLVNWFNNIDPSAPSAERTPEEIKRIIESITKRVQEEFPDHQVEVVGSGPIQGQDEPKKTLH